MHDTAGRSAEVIGRAVAPSTATGPRSNVRDKGPPRRSAWRSGSEAGRRDGTWRRPGRGRRPADTGARAPRRRASGALVSRMVRTATRPTARMTRGSTSSICRSRNGPHRSVSAGSGVAVPGWAALDGVGDEHLLAGQPEGEEHGAEQPARATHEGLSAPILVGAGPLADHHPVGIAGARRRTPCAGANGAADRRRTLPPRPRARATQGRGPALPPSRRGALAGPAAGAPGSRG